MSQIQGWARLWPAVKPVKAPTLRRGAWYPIVDSNPAVVILGVADRRIALPRRLVEVRMKQPTKFTVIHRVDDIKQRVASRDRRRSYAVCPSSRSRLPLFGHPEEMECPRCGHKGAVAWWETT